jgi:hypothetical protein
MPAPIGAAAGAAAQAGARVAGKAAGKAAAATGKAAGKAAAKTARRGAAGAGKVAGHGARRSGRDALRRAGTRTARRAVDLPRTSLRRGGAWSRRAAHGSPGRSDRMPDEVEATDELARRSLRRIWRIVRRLPGIGAVRAWVTLGLLLAVLVLFVLPLVFVVMDSAESAQANAAAFTGNGTGAGTPVAPAQGAQPGSISVLGPTDPHQPGNVTVTMQGVLDAVIPIFGRGYGIGCYDPSRSFGEHPLGRACDFSMANPLGQMPTPQDIDHGWGMANWLVEHHEELGVWYVIWQDLIWSADYPDQGWANYELYDSGCPTPESTSSENGSDCHTLQHWDHIHVSVL